MILRQGAPGLELLMVRRSMQASFMPGACVFPGGGVDASDGSLEHLACCDEAERMLQQRIGQPFLPFAKLGVAALLAHAAALSSLPPLHPRLQPDAQGCIAGVLLPGQAGYAEAGAQA